MALNNASGEEPVSPKDKKSMVSKLHESLGSLTGSLESLEARADPDAQATVTDFLDFTEYLPSDMIRSLTLIGKLDETYDEASKSVHDLTTTWGQIPNLPVEERPSPVQLRSDISESLNRVVSSRSFAHAEAARMAENVNRHYNRAKTIMTKLKTMLENYPTAEEQKSPVTVSKSPQLSRTPRPTLRGVDGEKVRRQTIPRITVPGEVLAPYDNFEAYVSSTDDASSEDDEEMDSLPGRAMAHTPAPRIKLVKPPKTPKAGKTPKANSVRGPKPNPSIVSTPVVPQLPLVEPPKNAPIGSTDAPWLQLTPWELARLRKRMKKNATWTPSDTMISRELNDLGRGIDAYRAAKKKAEEEGRPFDPAPTAIAAESESGTGKIPEGALSVAALRSDEVQLSNRGMKLNEAKKLKRESLAKQAAEEAEESTRRFNETARRLMGSQQPQQSSQSMAKPKTGKANNQPTNGTRAAANTKRKRDSMNEGETGKENVADTPANRPPVKRTKTETPVPLPQMRASMSSQTLTEPPALPPVLTPGGTMVTQSMTPVPVPIPGYRTVSPALSKENGTGTVTSSVPVKPPAETHIPPPLLSPKKSTTPIPPPVREVTKRETRGDAAKKPLAEPEQAEQANLITVLAPPQQPQHTQIQLRGSSAAPSVRRSVTRSRSRSMTPVAIDDASSSKLGRPGSRSSEVVGQDPHSSLATDQPRRTSTARNTPAPESRQPGKRSRRPAPGIVSTTTSGGSSAVGRRKKAPSVKKRVRTQKKDTNGQSVEEIEEVDDEGNPIDPNEPRYCVCNRVSFGTMISCDNPNCATEWFHIECVGLSAIPARTTKWYCPDCRVKLNIGEKGEVNARGVRM